jgi:hypothetical protein
VISSKIDRATINSERSLFDDLGECGVSVTTTPNIFRARAELHRDSDLSDEVTGASSYNMCAEHPIRLCVSEDFNKALFSFKRERSSVRYR